MKTKALNEHLSPGEKLRNLKLSGRESLHYMKYRDVENPAMLWMWDPIVLPFRLSNWHSIHFKPSQNFSSLQLKQNNDKKTRLDSYNTFAI